MYLLAFFIAQTLKKILATDPELWGCTILGSKMVHLPQTKLSVKIINIIFIYLLAPFIVQNFKKILPVDPELWGCTILGPIIVHLPKWVFFFFRKPVTEPCSFHSHPSTYQNIKVRYQSISTILTIKEYWNFIGQEPFLAFRTDGHTLFYRTLLGEAKFCIF